MTQVTSTNKQLKIVNNGIIEFYSYSNMKSISSLSTRPSKFNSGGNYVVINFTSNEANNPLKITLSLVDNQVTWVNTMAGAQVAVGDIAGWKETAGF